ncbi:MAG TPA: MOSC domain-containing protein [Candidatus Acidoferrales bacterium]|nr:MOSC domain-containing protein [Candidatus Acidoferrales bacterium]
MKIQSERKVAGTLRELRRYPVKGMAAEEMDEALVTFAGILGDRVYAFADPSKHTDFPWVTARTWPRMILLKTRFSGPAPTSEGYPNAASFQCHVIAEDGRTFNVNDAALREHLAGKFGHALEFRFSERSMQDSRPLSIFGTKTLAGLCAETGVKPDARRFRANLVVDWTNGGERYEDSLIGKRVKIGERVELMISKRDMRCKIITLDPETADATPKVLEVVAKQYEGYAGVYAVVLREGVIRRGDEVFVE